MPKGRYTHLARFALVLVALILLGLFACPPRGYAQALALSTLRAVAAMNCERCPLDNVGPTLIHFGFSIVD